jgi:hypothetical protein
MILVSVSAPGLGKVLGGEIPNHYLLALPRVVHDEAGIDYVLFGCSSHFVFLRLCLYSILIRNLDLDLDSVDRDAVVVVGPIDLILILIRMRHIHSHSHFRSKKEGERKPHFHHLEDRLVGSLMV